MILGSESELQRLPAAAETATLAKSRRRRPAAICSQNEALKTEDYLTGIKY